MGDYPTLAGTLQTVYDLDLSRDTIIMLLEMDIRFNIVASEEGATIRIVKGEIVPE